MAWVTRAGARLGAGLDALDINYFPQSGLIVSGLVILCSGSLNKNIQSTGCDVWMLHMFACVPCHVVWAAAACLGWKKIYLG